MASEIANNCRLLTAGKEIDYENDTFKIILMGSGFTFDPATDDNYSDVSGSELSTANGYTAGGATLAGVSVTQNDTTNRCEVTWNNATWTASGGDIGPFVGAIIYDDTVTNDPVIGFIDFGGTYTENNGGTLTVTDLQVDL